MHGKGIYTWKDGRKYEGEYYNDKKNVIFKNIFFLLRKWMNLLFQYINNSNSKKTFKILYNYNICLIFFNNNLFSLILNFY